MSLCMNPWGGVFVDYPDSLLDAAGMGVTLELESAAIHNAWPTDQRMIPDVDRNEACGEACCESALAAIAQRINADTIIDWLRATLGEAYVQNGTDMWSLCKWWDHIGVRYTARAVPVGEGLREARARGHVALGAVWTAYSTPSTLDPRVGGSIGHWILGGAVRVQPAAGGTLVKPILDGVMVPGRANAAWMVAGDGGVFTAGSASFFGSMGGKPLNAPMVSMGARPQGDGYWLVAADGGVFTFGAARFWGSMGGRPLNMPICGLLPSPSGNGYTLIAGDGGTFNFGDAAVPSLVGTIK